MNEVKLHAALGALAHAANRVEQFLAERHQEWSGYWGRLASNVRGLMTGPISRKDLDQLRHELLEPYRGTFGSMTDLVFRGDDERLYKAVGDAMFDAWTAVQEAFQEGEPHEGRIRRALLAIEEELLSGGHPEALVVRAVLDTPAFDHEAVRRIVGVARQKVSASALDALERELPIG